jgi:hypothetical protein
MVLAGQRFHRSIVNVNGMTSKWSWLRRAGGIVARDESAAR